MDKVRKKLAMEEKLVYTCIEAYVSWSRYSLFSDLYPYAIYPLILMAINIVSRSNEFLGEANYEPEVSIVMPFHRASVPLVNKIKEIFDLEYPNEKIELILVSNGEALYTEELGDSSHIKIKKTGICGKNGSSR